MFLRPHPRERQAALNSERVMLRPVGASMKAGVVPGSRGRPCFKEEGEERLIRDINIGYGRTVDSHGSAAKGEPDNRVLMERIEYRSRVLDPGVHCDCGYPSWSSDDPTTREGLFSARL